MSEMADEQQGELAEICATSMAMAQEIESMGLGFQMDPRAVQVQALVRILMDAGFLTEAQWERTIAEVQRDMLAAALAQAPQVKRQAEAEAARKRLIVPGRKQ
jgi:hypothetical protein